MEKALYNGKLLTPEQFEKKASREWQEKGLFARCPIQHCNRVVSPYGVHSLKVTPRFDHPDGVHDCPLSSTADVRYRNLQPRSVNPEVAQQTKNNYLATTSRQAKVFLAFILGNAFSQTVYNKMLDRVDELSIWSYADITNWSIPYILATLLDYKTSKGHDYQCNFQKPRNGFIDDLWLTPEGCKLAKEFSNSGTLMTYPEGNPYPVSEAFFQSIKK